MRTLVLAAILIAQTAAQRPVGVVTGQVLFKDGRGAEGIRVAAMDVQGSGAGAGEAALTSFALTDASGHYRMDDVPAGSYYIIAGSLNAPTYYPGVAQQAQAKAVAVTAGKTLSGIDFSMPPPLPRVTVSGRIRGLPPAAMNLMRLRLVQITGGSGAIETVPQPDGAFEFLKVPPGDHRLMISGLVTNQMKAIQVGGKDLEVELAVPSMLVGRVSVDDGTKLPIDAAALLSGASDVPLFRLLARRVDRSSASSIMPVGPDRIFVLPNVGEYRFSAAVLPFGYSVKSISWGDVDITQTPLKMTDKPESAPEIHMVLTTTPPPGGAGVTVRGRVKGLPAGGLPVRATGNPGATSLWVSMTSSTRAADGVLETRVGQAEVRPDGTFEIQRVPPGTYFAQVLQANSGMPAPMSPSDAITVSDRDVDGLELPFQGIASPRPFPAR